MGGNCRDSFQRVFTQYFCCLFSCVRHCLLTTSQVSHSRPQNSVPLPSHIFQVIIHRFLLVIFSYKRDGSSLNNSVTCRHSGSHHKYCIALCLCKNKWSMSVDHDTSEFVLLHNLAESVYSNPRANTKVTSFQWPKGLRRGSASAFLLGLRVRIPPESWMSVSCECCVLSEGSATVQSLVRSMRVSLWSGEAITLYIYHEYVGGGQNKKERRKKERKK
jgi:hypothetical protein